MKAFRLHVKMTVLALAMVVCIVVYDLVGFKTTEVKADQQQTPVQYSFYNEGNGSFETKMCNTYVTVGNATELTMSEDRWYVFEGTVTIDNRVMVSGTANIILMNGCVFTASKGINVASGSALNIYGQTINGENETRGILEASGDQFIAGIGGGKNESAGHISINGGEVNSTGGAFAAGIGGGGYANGGYITITGGIVTSTGGLGGAGIGGGDNGNGGRITIIGGEVTANYGSGGAGIGGGSLGNGGCITIIGGEVTANADAGGGAGIGGGSLGNGGSITITGGMIKAIGGGVYITGGSFENSYLEGAGIGDGAGSGTHGTYSLTGMEWFASTSENSGYEVVTGSGTFGENKKYAIAYKEHSGSLVASGSSITARYIDRSGDKQSIDMTIKAPREETIVFDGVATAGASLDGCDNFNLELRRTGNEMVSASQIKYYERNGRQLRDAPTAKGTYTAKITVDGVTASVDYEITKKDPAITLSRATSLEYTGDDQALIIQGLTTGGTLKYCLSERGTFNTDIPTGKNAGTYTVYYKVEGNDVYKSTITYSVPVEITKANLNLSLTQSGWAKGGQMPLSILNGNSGDGAVTYLYKKCTEDDSAYSDNVPTEAGNYIIKASVAETTNYFGAETSATFTISGSGSVIPTPATPVYTPDPMVEKVNEVPEPSIFSRKNKDGSETKIEIIWNADGTTTVINENKQADGTTVVKEETRDAKGNGTLKIEKKDANGNLLSSTEGTIGVNKKGTETIKSTTKNVDGSVSEKTQKTYKRDPNADNNKKVTVTEKKTDAEGNTETIKTTALVGVLGDATITEKSTFTYAGTNGITVVSDGSEENGTEEESKSGTDKGGSKEAKIVVKEERNYSLSVNGRLKLMSLASDGEKLTIPESIELDGMKRVVKAIGKNAMKGNKTVKEVVIGENITTICTGSFKNCKNLELIELTGSIKTIYKNAFRGIAKNAKFVIKAAEEDFARIVELIKKSGVGDSVIFERVE